MPQTVACWFDGRPKKGSAGGWPRAWTDRK